MRRGFWILLLVWSFPLDPAHAQATSVGDLLSTVEITARVTAGGSPLPAGTYELRLSNDRPAPPSGAPAAAQQFVELVRDRKVVAREVAEVLRDEDLPPIGQSSRRVASGTVVEMLKGGEFLRISVKRGGVRYLVHLPVRR
jgi:hypothetical protein